MEYDEFLKEKEIKANICGFECEEINNKLFDFQKQIVKWALKRGKACIFADTGLGKTMMQLEWARQVSKHTHKPVLIIAPLCVADQTVNEGNKINVDVSFVREFSEASIQITNYEMIDNFAGLLINKYYSGVVLDESSILKHQDSKTRIKILELCKDIDYKLSCTATPSPNDYMELGSQSEFMGIMSTVEMLSMFFIHDSGDTSKWRLKGHGASKFWEWMSTWCVYIKKPSNIGFKDDGYNLPDLNIEHIEIGGIFDKCTGGLVERHEAKRETVDERVLKCAEIVNSSKEQFIVWCMRNDESKKLKHLIKGSVEVSGDDSIEEKHNKIMSFTNNESRVIITKPKIAGFGMNWQHCHNMIFVGLSDSYEQIYQCMRRCWRYGQKNIVNALFIAHQREGNVLKNIKRKEKQAEEMSNNLIKFMSEFQNKEIFQLEREKVNYEETIKEHDGWKMYLGDCVTRCKELKDESIDYSIFSPPFASLYTYSNSDRDMGNCTDYEQFNIHFSFLIKELHRILRNGRNVSVHCMNLPTSKVRDGYIGLRDFRGDIIRAFQKEGFIYHSEAVIWKDPVLAMQRTKALGLLWKQIKKDSSKCRQGIPDYIVTFRKSGENTKPITHTPKTFPVDKWQHYASPCWMDIRQSNTLNGKFATENDDERHICPLQLDVIFRCLDLWSMEGDIVLSPFAGIGSEGFVALQMKRKFIGIELKKSYFNYAVKNLEIAERTPLLDYIKETAKSKIHQSKIGNGDLKTFFKV